jgi:hypothetical protein
VVVESGKKLLSAGWEVGAQTVAGCIPEDPCSILKPIGACIVEVLKKACED